MSQVIKISIAAIAIFVFALISYVGLVQGAYFHEDHYQHSHIGSPAGNGIDGWTLLEKEDGIRDARLCAQKTRPGNFTLQAIGLDKDNGHIYIVGDREFGNGKICHDTNHNLEWHRASTVFWYSGQQTNFGEKSYHPN